MNRFLAFILIAIFSIFLGSQITEGVLLVTYWKSLPTKEFYDYYVVFGPLISSFYTFLTIISVLIPFGSSIYCYYKKKFDTLKYSVLSTIFAFLIIIIFYSYFKGTNQLFYTRAFDTNELKSVLNTWENWHWLRVLFEVLSLIFLILTLSLLKKPSTKVKSDN